MRRADLPDARTLDAPAAWRTVDFISDLHLQAGEPATADAWRRYMAAPGADAIFILGDLFEVWVGDDAAQADDFLASCVAVLRETARRVPVHFMAGNRDFLVGDALLGSLGVVPLADPSVLVFAGRRWLLTHGDALCLDDTEYLAFRAEVRAPSWRAAFLARPLPERQAVARAMREASQAAQQRKSAPADVDPQAALALADAARADALIHGHTHRPADHPLGARGTRHVLTDWDAASAPPRLEALRLSAAGVQRVPLS